MKYSVVTFGCRVNQADSLSIESKFRARGATAVSPEQADVVVVNSCSVTASADQGTRQAIRRIVRANPGVKVIVTGCYATRRPEELRQLPGVVHLVPNERKETLDHLVDLTTSERFGNGDGACGENLTPGVGGRTAVTLRVQTGCEEACSYCIIPETRGPGRSRPLRLVLEDIRRVVEAGYKEIVITGVHLGSYGRDLADGMSLTSLVGALAEWPDDVLFRISSLEPMDCGDGIVEMVASSPRLAPYFHLPLQHGSDTMLNAMRRPYTVQYYRLLVEGIRRRIPDASVGSDIIVGFPGETQSQFDDMCSVLDELPLTHLHVFPYSDRPGTIAARLHPKVDGRTIRDRGRTVRDISARMARRFRQSQAGRTMRALAVDDGRSAVTGNYLKLRLPEPHERNEWITVTVPHGEEA